MQTRSRPKAQRNVPADALSSNTFIEGIIQLAKFNTETRAATAHPPRRIDGSNK